MEYDAITELIEHGKWLNGKGMDDYYAPDKDVVKKARHQLSALTGGWDCIAHAAGQECIMDSNMTCVKGPCKIILPDKEV